MGMSCVPAPTNKKEYITHIGKILVLENGKKKYYKPEEVKKAHKESKWGDILDAIDFACWAMSVFNSRIDFENYHEEIGEDCDYIAMKTEMLSGLSSSSNVNWTEIPDIDIDTSWLDFGDVFDGFLEGIGEIISGIFE